MPCMSAESRTWDHERQIPAEKGALRNSKVAIIILFKEKRMARDKEKGMSPANSFPCVLFF